MRRTLGRRLFGAMTTCGLELAGPALAGRSGMPWKGPLQQVVGTALDAGAVSRAGAGAGGLPELMTGTAAELGVTDRSDVDNNLYAGTDYLARQLLRFGDMRRALAAANSGPGRVARLGLIPEIVETQNYVDSVVGYYLALSAGRDVRHARDCRSTEGGS